jgi:hypothetical protein
MINCVLFSKDRAMQVDATLRSFFARCLDPENAIVKVLYTCSNAQHSRQYQQLIRDWNKYPRITFFKEKDFKEDFITILNPFLKLSFRNFSYKLLMQGDSRIARRLKKYIAIPRTDSIALFLVDDAVFTSEFKLAEIKNALIAHPDVLGFSLRLGKNITHSYMLRRDEVQPTFNFVSENILKFRWTDGDLDFNYPLEVSSSVYRIEDVISSLIGVSFTNPNLLEGSMNINRTRLLTSRPNLLCYSSSVAFCDPINIVQTVSLENRRGGQLRYSSNELADLFDQGKRINIDSFYHFVPNSCHMEVDLSFFQNEAIHE